MITQYLNFDLLFDQTGDQYRVRVVNSPAGRAEHNFQLPYSAETLSRINRALEYRSLDIDHETAPFNIKELGSTLFDTIFAGDILSLFQKSQVMAADAQKGLRIRLRLSSAPYLVNLPWEYLFDTRQQQFVGLSVDSTIVRDLDTTMENSPPPLQNALNILAMISNPVTQAPLDVEKEWNRIDQATQHLQTTGRIKLVRLESPTLAELQHALRRGEYHVFHYVGHADYNDGKQDAVLMLEDEQKQAYPVSGEDLGILLHDEKTLRLALLNACETAKTAATNPFSGMGQTLLKKGLPAVIAMQFKISDQAAIIFTQEFYTALVDGYPVDAAVTEARKMIHNQLGGEEWATPVLYMRTDDGRVFNFEPEPATESAITVITKAARSTYKKYLIAALTFALAISIAFVLSRHPLQLPSAHSPSDTLCTSPFLIITGTDNSYQNARTELAKLKKYKSELPSWVLKRVNGRNIQYITVAEVGCEEPQARAILENIKKIDEIAKYSPSLKTYGQLDCLNKKEIEAGLYECE